VRLILDLFIGLFERGRRARVDEMLEQEDEPQLKRERERAFSHV
jgi:hypothetical protein